jgi:hypothetical protein
MAFDIHRIDRIDPESNKAERQFEKYQNDLLGRFFDSPEGKKRLAENPGMGGWIVHLMDYGYNYLGVAVTGMTAGNVREIVEDIFPRKISLQSPADADDAIPELKAFWEYLKREFLLPQAGAVLNLLTKIEPGFKDLMTDPSRFGMAKSFFMMGQAAGFDMTSQEVRRREQEHPTAALPSGINPLLLARSKAEPMARGFFPAVEREAVQRVLEQSVIFLTADNIHELITSARWLRTAWRIANIYLDRIDAAPMGKDEDLQPVGLGEETTSYISLKYFNEDDPFADYVVHEMAHLFHNWKRALIGLRETRYKEFLLNISFAKREIFAFSCEAYSRILELGKTPSERRQLFKRFSCESRIPLGEEKEELLQIVKTAVEARN